MSGSPFRPAEPAPPAEALVREAVEVLLAELAVIAEHRWADLPDVKKRKVVVASRLRALPGEEPSLVPQQLLTILLGLESQTRRQAELFVERSGRQILALQEARQYCVECASVSFCKF